MTKAKITDIDGLQTELDDKAELPINISDVTDLQSELDDKAELPIGISDVTNLQSELDDKLEDAPSDGNRYLRKDGNWTVLGNSSNWIELASQWSSEPTLFGTATVSGQSGDVYSYSYNSSVSYRFVPNTYDPTLDGFYSDSGLTTLIVNRG